MPQAICSSNGCLVGAVGPIQAGVELESGTKGSVWLLPGNYSSQTPSVSSNSSTSLLSSFLGAGVFGANETAGAGFDLFALSASAQSIRVGPTSDMIGYSDENYAGTPVLASIGGQTGQAGLRSVYLDNSTFGVFAVSTDNSSTTTLQIYDSVPDTGQLGLGDNVTLQLAALVSATNTSTNYCQRGFYRVALQCLPCTTSCQTCWNATQCLSCSSNQTLLDGTCRPATCAGDIGPVPGMGVCLEAFVAGSDNQATEGTVSKLSPVIIAAIVISSVVGAIIVALALRKLWQVRSGHHGASSSSASSKAPLTLNWQDGKGSELSQSTGAPPFLTYPGAPWPYLPFARATQPPANAQTPNYPHFGANPSHAPYKTPEEDEEEESEMEEVERYITRPLTYLGIPKLKKRKKSRRNRRREQSGWLRRLTSHFGAQSTPPVPPVPSVVDDSPGRDDPPMPPAKAKTKPERQLSLLDEIISPRQMKRPMTPSVDRPPPAKSAMASPSRERGMTWVKDWSAEAATAGQETVFEPPPMQKKAKPKKAPGARVEEEDQPIEEDLMSERRRKVTTRLANWLVDSSSPPQHESELEEQLQSSDDDEDELRRISGMSDWEQRRRDRKGKHRRR